MAAVIAPVLLGACGGSDDAGGRLPDVEVQTLRESEAFRLDELEGPAVVNLWATWCAPCKRELPEFEAVHRSLAGEVTFVGVNIGDDGDEAADYLDDLGITYDQYLDFDSELTAALETATLPVTLIIDADEQIALRHIGPLDQDELIEAIEQQARGIELNKPTIATMAATTPTVIAPTVTARSIQYGTSVGNNALLRPARRSNPHAASSRPAIAAAAYPPGVGPSTHAAMANATASTGSSHQTGRGPVTLGRDA